MMRSLFSGVSGLRVHQTRMDVIGHNIANVNTVGYKSSRATFSEIFSQTTSGASPANPETGRGGTNPQQIGLGASVASIDKIMTQGAAQRTDNPFDLMIQGEGFFIVGDTSGQYFTRAGALNVDAQGNLVTSTGLTVMGWNQIDEETGRAIPGIVQSIVIGPDKESIPPNATTQTNLTGNLNADSNTSIPKVMSMTIYDSVGNKYVVDVQMQYNKLINDYAAAGIEGAWETSLIPIAYLNGDRENGGTALALDADGNIQFTGNPPAAADDNIALGDMTFDTNGNPIAFVPEGGGLARDATTGVYTSSTATPDDIRAESLKQLVIGLVPGPQLSDTGTATTPNNTLIPSGTFGDEHSYEDSDVTIQNSIIFDFSQLTQYGTLGSDAITSPKDGNAPGSLNGMSIGTDGSIMGRYSNGQVKVLAQIPVAMFKNPAGMEKVGDNLFVPTANSGEFNGTGDDISASGGSIKGGVLEMSNVDLSNEFVDMITTQRGFQANSRIITTSDEMLQELVNLKR